MSLLCGTERETRSLLVVPGLAVAETQALLQTAQSGAVAGPACSKAWQNRHVAVVAKDDTDPSSAVFAQASRSLGAHVSHLKPADLGLRKSAQGDMALVLLGRLYYAIGCAGLSRSTVALLQRSAGVLVLSDLAAATHPSRLLADVMTLKQFLHGSSLATLPQARLGIYGPPRSGLLRAWKSIADSVEVEVVDLSEPESEMLADSCSFLCRPSAPPELCATQKPTLQARAETSLMAQQSLNHLRVVQAMLRSGSGAQR